MGGSRSRVLCAALLVAAAQRVPAGEPDEQRLLEEARVPDPYAAAAELGRRRSAAGLAMLIEQGDERRVSAYVSSFPHDRIATGPPEPLPPDIEAFVVKHFDDRRFGWTLQTLVTSNGYRSRAMFDLLQRRLALPELDDSDWASLATLLVQTDRSIERLVLELLQGSASRVRAGHARCELARFLARRRYAPGVAYVRKMLRGSEPRDGRCLAGALVASREKSPLDAVLDYIDDLGTRRRDPTTARGVLQDLLQNLTMPPADVPIDFDHLRRLMPAPPDDLVMTYIQVVQRRNETAGVPDLIRYLAETAPPAVLHHAALAALRDFDDPDVWKRARAEIERLHQAGALDPWQYSGATSQLDVQLADPDAFRAERRRKAAERDAEQAFWRARRELDARHSRAEQLRDTDPAAYANEEESYLRGVERLAGEHPEAPSARGGAGDLLAFSSLALGDYVRFRLREPARAVVLYERAAKLNSLRLITEFDIADTYEFELADRARAAAGYRRELGEMRKLAAGTTDGGAAMGFTLGERFLEEEIRWLETGKPFVGTIGREDVVAAAFPLAAFSTPMQELGIPPDIRAAIERRTKIVLDPGQVARWLDDLPPSHLSLFRTTPLLSLVPAEVILRHLERNDPAHFLSALILATGLYRDQRREAGSREYDRVSPFLPPATRTPSEARSTLRDAAESFAARAGIRFDVAPFASPEEAWQHFVEALRRGDARHALDTCSPRLQQQLADSLGKMPAAEMVDLGQSLIAITPDEDMGALRRYRLTRRGGAEDEHSVFFTKYDGEWTVHQVWW